MDTFTSGLEVRCMRLENSCRATVSERLTFRVESRGGHGVPPLQV